MSEPENLRILVVEDERHIAPFPRQVLEKVGFQVMVALDGKIAMGIRSIASGRFCVTGAGVTVQVAERALDWVLSDARAPHQAIADPRQMLEAPIRLSEDSQAPASLPDALTSA